ncbi:hypothetical protein [uncultured Idiomarina sp.]|uniref:hypothetical protein n=1 Tax=uncultured Idiomarina sp. TaxID=352961 RepID=UPI002597C8F9|nr:hypothetical protein [uncultured Idiomarina sp.]
MPGNLDELLIEIKDELDSEQMDDSHVLELFQELRAEIKLVVSNQQIDEENKARKLDEVLKLLNSYEAEALKQKELIQEGLKKLTKGRRSMKEYKENT